MPIIQDIEVSHAGFEVIFTKPPWREWCELINWLRTSKAEVATVNCDQTVRARYAIVQLPSVESVEAKIQSLLGFITTSYKFKWNIRLVWHTTVRFTHPLVLPEQQNISQALLRAIGMFPSWDEHDSSFFVVKTSTRPDSLFVETVKQIAIAG